MPFIFRNLTISPDKDENILKELTAKRLGLSSGLLRNFRITRKGVDARKKPNVKLVYTVSFSLDNDAALRGRINSSAPAELEWKPEKLPTLFVPARRAENIVIVGTGPAGLFCALRLAEYGFNVTILERGQLVERRAMDVQRFWKDGTLDPESNVQFGEGGAGTFSDGKLTSRSRDSLTPWILRTFADFGAPQSVLYLAKPHIGTDRLRNVVANMRRHLLGKGSIIHFGRRLSDIVIKNGRCVAGIVNDNEEIPCDRLILATGHSARDTYEMLLCRAVPLEPKAFAMGLRVEHPQTLIDSIQYGSKRHPNLPVADYTVAWNNPANGRGVYSFCMCPGGVVVAGASEEGGVVTNGMSGHLRDSSFANSALVVTVAETDFGGSGPLAGVNFQRHWERRAFNAGGGCFRAPAQTLLSFMGLPGKGILSGTYRPGIVEADLETILPSYVTAALREGVAVFNKRLRGFISSEAVMIGVESRTSSPVRIIRNKNYESIGVERLYPAGEGAGYAGGIMSSAIDGAKIADIIALSAK